MHLKLRCLLLLSLALTAFLMPVFIGNVAANGIEYLLTVVTEPPGLSPQPTRNPLGSAGPQNNTWWYLSCTYVTLNAQTVEGYIFSHWEVDGVSQGIGVNPITVHMNANHVAKAVYVPSLSVSISPAAAKIKVGESVTFTSTVSGGKQPYQYQWYLNGTPVSSATSPSWTFAPTSEGFYRVYLKVTDAMTNTADSNVAEVTVAPRLTVSISPASASIVLGQSVSFTSTVSGGYPPYNYQWYVNGMPVSGATSATYEFKPASAGIYYVYLKVLDSNDNVVESEAARITVSPVPVGGYSVPLARQELSYFKMAIYTVSILFCAVMLSLVKRKVKHN